MAMSAKRKAIAWWLIKGTPNVFLSAAYLKNKLLFGNKM